MEQVIDTQQWSKGLSSWQKDFAQTYLAQSKRKALLVASPGTGKTSTALYTAALMRERHICDSLMILNDRSDLRNQWTQLATKFGLNLRDNVDLYRKSQHDGFSITTQSLRNPDRFSRLLDLAKSQNWFGIVEESHRTNKSVNEIVDKVLDANTNSKFLFIVSDPPSIRDDFDAQFRFGTEFIFQDSIVRLPETKVEISRFSPSFSILQKLLKGNVRVDDLSWREFERLISELLEKDGYEVNLMQGSKDGGVDVVATKHFGESGLFKVVWQAKKHLKNKVGLSVIRELADTRDEFKASKGVIVTTTYLTHPALARVQRDKYILGKVDRDDLNRWIRKSFARVVVDGRAIWP